MVDYIICANFFRNIWTIKFTFTFIDEIYDLNVTKWRQLVYQLILAFIRPPQVVASALLPALNFDANLASNLSATLRSHQTELNQNRPHAGK